MDRARHFLKFRIILFYYFYPFSINLTETGRPLWYNYFLCGIKGILEHFNLEGNLENGMMIIVSGNLPACAGLSSSSALVSSAALCTAYINHLDLDKQRLAQVAAKCERYIGTIGGGMDQAIAYLAKSGCAQFIEWNPLRATSVHLPQGAIFVIANSLAEANKAATSDFNQRVIECRLGCKLVAKQLGLTNWKEFEKYSHLQKILECNLVEVEQFVDQYLNQELYTRDTLLDLFDIGEDEFIEDLLTPNTRNAKTFKLRQRGLHVIQETIRVHRFKDIAENEADLQELSKLMRQSHESLKTLYECSHPQLDQLIEISDEMGVGARLTGAGWGGCIVALCDTKTKCLDYIAAIKERYYLNLPQAKGRNFDELIFATSPQQGAQIYLNEIL